MSEKRNPYPVTNAGLIKAVVVSNDQSQPTPTTESFWVRPINKQLYEVRNVLYHFPLVVGDQIALSESPKGKPVVTNIVKLLPGWYMKGQLSDELPQATTAFNDLEQTALQLEAGYGAFYGHWDESYSFEDLTAILHEAQPNAGFAVVYHELARRDWLANHVDFAAANRPEPAALEYWAADDPKWRQLGLASPTFLAHVQTLVRDNPELLKLIESRRYSKAVRWINKYDEVLEQVTSA